MGTYVTSSPVTSFVKKLYDMVSNEPDDLVSFTASGNAFEVKNPRALELEVLPKYFRHSRFQSFVRQLNFYNFKKISKERSIWVYRHSLFNRDKPHLLRSLKRKTNQSSSAEGKSSRGGAGAVGAGVEAYHLEEHEQHGTGPTDCTIIVPKSISNRRGAAGGAGRSPPSSSSSSQLSVQSPTSSSSSSSSSWTHRSTSTTTPRYSKRNRSNSAQSVDDLMDEEGDEGEEDEDEGSEKLDTFSPRWNSTTTSEASWSPVSSPYNGSNDGTGTDGEQPSTFHLPPPRRSRGSHSHSAANGADSMRSAIQSTMQHYCGRGREERQGGTEEHHHRRHDRQEDRCYSFEEGGVTVGDGSNGETARGGGGSDGGEHQHHHGRYGEGVFEKRRSASGKGVYTGAKCDNDNKDGFPRTYGSGDQYAPVCAYNGGHYSGAYGGSMEDGEAYVDGGRYGDESRDGGDCCRASNGHNDDVEADGDREGNDDVDHYADDDDGEDDYDAGSTSAAASEDDDVDGGMGHVRSGNDNCLHRHHHYRHSSMASSDNDSLYDTVELDNRCGIASTCTTTTTPTTMAAMSATTFAWDWSKMVGFGILDGMTLASAREALTRLVGDAAGGALLQVVLFCLQTDPISSAGPGGSGAFHEDVRDLLNRDVQVRKDMDAYIAVLHQCDLCDYLGTLGKDDTKGLVRVFAAYAMSCLERVLAVITQSSVTSKTLLSGLLEPCCVKWCQLCSCNARLL